MDKAFLQGCLERGMSLPEIGREVGRPVGAVGYWVRKHGLVANGRAKFSPRRDVPADALEAGLEEGLTLAQLGERFGVCGSTVYGWIESRGLDGTRAMRRSRLIREAREKGIQEIVLDCRVHGQTPFWIGRKAVRCRKCNSAGVAGRRRKVKQILVDEAGGRCRVCGFNGCPVALEFHHLDPRSKSFGLSEAGISRSLAASRAEAAKCVLLCANCHAQVEAGVIVLPVQ